jgi:hypothetical protein
LIKSIHIKFLVKIIERGNKVFQHFIHSKAKGFKYIEDSRFAFKEQFERRIASMLLSDKGFIFIERRVEEDRIVFEYNKDENSEEIEVKSYAFSMAGFVADKPSCDDCVFSKETNGFIFCEKMQKNLPNKKKNCSIFKQREGGFKT